MNRLYVAAAMAVLLIALIAGVLLERSHYGATRYAAGEQAGRNAVLAEQAPAMEKLQQQRDQREQSSALATGTLSQTLGEKLPAIEAQSHASEDTIRIIYRDRPGAADQCVRPAGVQEQLDQAVAGANAAATAHGQL